MTLKYAQVVQVTKGCLTVMCVYILTMGVPVVVSRVKVTQLLEVTVVSSLTGMLGVITNSTMTPTES
jgi:uncharacterized membrane protein